MKSALLKTALFAALLLHAASTTAQNQQLQIKDIRLDYPKPGIPFYHCLASVELPTASIIEVEMSVNGKTLRATDLYREGQLGDPDYPALTHRPPSGYGLSFDATRYKSPDIVGWVAWEPGKTYDIKVTVRMKASPKPSAKDVFLSATRKVTAPAGVPVFDRKWKSYKSIVLSETAGMDRINEPVEALLAFYPDESVHIARDVRVVEVDPRTYQLREVPCQVYDVTTYKEEDNMDPDANGNPTRKIPLWFPTTTARIAFLANVPAHSRRIYLVYYNNPDAMAKTYQTDLRIQGEKPGITIDNDHYSIVLHPASGHIDQITLKSIPDFPLYHRMETNGAVHWNPDVYSPPRAWTHTADWKQPENSKFMPGPIKATSEVWDQMRGISEVDASVRYEFYPGMPYMISSSTMRINETVHCLALRNAEIVFKRELLNRLVWPDEIRDTIINYDVLHMPDLTDVKMEADVPWLLLYNDSANIAFAGIQLEYMNTGLENRERLLNPYMYVTGGPWIYWSRALSLSFLSSNMQQLIPALKGNFFAEKWAYVTYRIAPGEQPWDQTVQWMKKLKNPLRIHLTEEVDDRVSRAVQEVFMDEGKSGWEGRDTGKHSDH
ncbi:MAG: hypothetical protein RI973_461 [Bacteroidota bacterium]|jgi:hypothetical protein